MIHTVQHDVQPRVFPLTPESYGDIVFIIKTLLEVNWLSFVN